MGSTGRKAAHSFAMESSLLFQVGSMGQFEEGEKFEEQTMTIFERATTYRPVGKLEKTDL